MRYGITLEEYEEMLDEQGGTCACCDAEPSERDRGGRLAVDHCHETGRVRALLCQGCNLAVGHLKDDLNRARALVTYLARA